MSERAGVANDVILRGGDHLPPLPFWQAVTGVLYNVAIAAAVHSRF